MREIEALFVDQIHAEFEKCELLKLNFTNGVWYFKREGTQI